MGWDRSGRGSDTVPVDRDIAGLGRCLDGACDGLGLLLAHAAGDDRLDEVGWDCWLGPDSRVASADLLDGVDCRPLRGRTGSPGCVLPHLGEGLGHGGSDCVRDWRDRGLAFKQQARGELAETKGRGR